MRTRLWMGALLVVLTFGVLVLDQRFAPVYPFLLALVLVLALGACFELLQLLHPRRASSTGLCFLAVAALVGVNWLAHWLPVAEPRVVAWKLIALVFGVVVLAAFLAEMAVFREPGESVTRIALTVWVVAYLALLPCFLVQLRWLPDLEGGAGVRGTVALALAIFVPKMCDTGAYFTGRLLGKHPMAPVLSPKKTLEGAMGGLALAVLTAVGLNRLGPAITGGLLSEAAFGLTVGLTGMFGDLAESLVKRDCQKKDASQVVPGFGGVLDVVDSIVFAAPVAYLWLA